MTTYVLDAWVAASALVLLLLVVRYCVVSLQRSNRAAPENQIAQAASMPVNAITTVSHELDRELGILAFSARVLQLARDTNTPVGERLHYARIVAANLDEFYSVQINRRINPSSELIGAQTWPHDEGLERVHAFAHALSDELHNALNEAMQELSQHGFNVHKVSELPDEVRDLLRATFAKNIGPQLLPRSLWPDTDSYWRTAPSFEWVAAVVYLDAAGVRRCDGIAIPASLAGFLQYADTNNYVTLADVLGDCVDTVVNGLVEYVSFFRTTHLAESARAPRTRIAAPDFAWTEREHTPVTRIEVEATMPVEDRTLLQEALFSGRERVSSVAVIAVPALKDVNAIRGIANTLPEEFRFPPLTPRIVPNDADSFWDTIRASDVFLHHPYDDFAHSVVRFFQEAADDAAVQRICVVLYRIGDESPIADALMRAAANGKQVFVVIELRARGDELRNADWANRFEAAGVHVVRGQHGLRNHAKIALVERVELGEVQSYAHVGTGNYHSVTAAAYSDFGLLTARTEICEDLRAVFSALRDGTDVDTTGLQSCLVAPDNLRRQIRNRIVRETEYALAGRPARIRMKMNGLVDRTCIQLLYEASQAGVQVELIVRGICTLRPGVKGLSENIRVTSIIGRFLEHARVFAFDNDGNPEYFIGSADLRPRNLHRRVEVLVPLLSPDVRVRMDDILNKELREPSAWTLNADGSYSSETLNASINSTDHFVDPASWSTSSRAAGTLS